MLLALAALGATAFAGCGSGGSAQSSGQEGQRVAQSAGPSDQKTVEASWEARATDVRLGHPALGSADAPVVLTEYSDYQ